MRVTDGQTDSLTAHSIVECPLVSADVIKTDVNTANREWAVQIIVNVGAFIGGTRGGRLSRHVKVSSLTVVS